ncbi:MAG: hypothetical protein DME56_04915 [Verrucomicrobia bacterium]|nr:MAG: hypothetical protein DME56_04915 [Verrucomicrobiota bacterium]
MDCNSQSCRKKLQIVKPDSRPKPQAQKIPTNYVSQKSVLFGIHSFVRRRLNQVHNGFNRRANTV